MVEQIVALSVDKIQTFLTEVIHSHVQEKQTEDATLKGIRNSSYQISNGFFKSIQDTFPESDKDVLLECSGVYIFRCTLSEEELEKRLNALFSDYYRESQGQKLIRWVHFSSEGLSNIAAINEAKKRLKQTKNWNEIVRKNQDLLFSFCQVPKEDNQSYFYRNQETFPAFAEDINSLYGRKDGEKEDDVNEGKKRFRIAVLKADLDKMGAMFKGIKDYQDYRNISQILNEMISLTGLHQAAAECAPKGKNGWLFPLYIAGDDIFFAVALEDLIDGINVCRQIMQTVNDKINSTGNPTKLAMSIGVEITFNREPIRYYMEMVEIQLKNAKSQTVPKALEPFFIMKLSVGNLTFFNIDYGMIKETREALKCSEGGKRGCRCENCSMKLEIKRQLQNVPIWNFFLNDVNVLNYIRSSKSGCSEQLGKPNFFYTLLEDITEEAIRNNPVKYINHILYHLMPAHLEDAEQRVSKLEQILNSNIIKQLYQKDSHGLKLVVNRNTMQRFETYLRLMIFFCDARFRISNQDEWETYEKKYQQDKKEISSYLFKQPAKHLYENCLIGKNKQLTDVFVKIDKIPKSHKEGYRRLMIEKSMFFRLRDVDSMPIEKAAEIIELRNPSTQEELQKINLWNEKRIKEGKHPNRLYFDKKSFIKIAKKDNVWSPDFIDSLMLFYQYHEMVMISQKKDRE